MPAEPRVEPPEETPNWLTPGLREGSEETWRHFNFVYGGWVYGIARRRGLEKEDARDMVQDVMMSVYRSLNGFRRDEEGATFQGWVYAIARRRVADHLEGRRRSRLGPSERPLESYPDPRPDEDEEGLPETERDWLRKRVEGRAAEHFRGESWSAFVAVVLEGEPAAEFARRSGLRPETVRKQVGRAREWLRSLQSSELFPDAPADETAP